MSSEIEKSALLTMEMLAKSFGARTVMFDFTASKPEQRNVTDISTQQAALPRMAQEAWRKGKGLNVSSPLQCGEEKNRAQEFKHQFLSTRSFRRPPAFP